MRQRSETGCSVDINSLKSEFHLSLTSTVPLYMQLANYISMNIKSGDYKIGEKLFTENELCDALGISRTTVRLAFDKLLSDNLIVRRRGKGTFINDRKLRRNINYMYSFTENVREVGVVPSSIVLSSSVEAADETLMRTFKLSENNNSIFKLSRLRCGDNVPLLHEISCLPYYLCKGIERFDFSVHSLYQVLETHYSLNFVHAIESIEAVLIDKDSAKLLDCPAKTLGYHIERTSFLDTGQVFEFTQSTTRADKTSFRLDLFKNKKTNTNSVDFQRLVSI